MRTHIHSRSAVTILVGGALAFLLIVASSAVPAHAIVIRHDRDAARYLELGSRYPSVCKVGRRMGDGTLVSPRHILTAAHVARGLNRVSGPVVTCEGTDYAVATFFIHPDWHDMGPHDIAILELVDPVTGIDPLPLFTGDDEVGRIAVLVGHGMTGTGDDRERSEDGRRRAATNMIEDGNDRRFRFHFDAPPAGTELEGIPGGGDSGGPAIIDVDGVEYVAGVSSMGQPGANGPGTYGADDYFGRVSTHVAWIGDAIDGRAEPYRPAAAVVPAGMAGERLQGLIDLIAAGPNADIESFMDDHMVPAPDRRERRIEAIRELVQNFEGATLAQIAESSDTKVVAIFSTPDGDQLLGVEIEAQQPHRIAALMTGRP